MSKRKEEDVSGVFAFKSALEAEHRERLRVEETKLDDELGEIVSNRRIEVEKEVTRRREAQKQRARTLRESLHMEILGEIRQRLAGEVQEMICLLEKRVFEEVGTLRGSPRYEEALLALAREGQTMVGGKVRFLVSPADTDVLQALGGDVLVQGSDEVADGGCLVIREPEGDRLVDNSLRSRWEHLVRELSKEISHRVTPLFDELEETF